ncbi:hypothetical protein HYH02_000774 [Chlamydomonas schloesseri]|uniref:Expansin-like EG45 domain-containing protein n=1 Tax=Chlamydomonas schloesseri TaxID=2026947 RepID=A0A835WWG6_9CHLO|nr:hypothetical protein HYH02_000774 [Chlamydomonas schloesseri]|eukprot:KAG2454946.1 hypothetical protein HYH02_000774 [Chlamydomonas schloesseri]
MPDVAPEYADSCGTCYEVKCDPSTFTDGYGQALDRTQACYDADASLVFRVTDTCPCVYPENAYSNKRWCCGDMPHFDLSIWGFERLASTKWGVIGLKYRRVPCDYVPAKEASSIAYPTPGEQPLRNAPRTVRDWPELTNTTSSSVYNGGLAPGWSDQSYNVKAASTAIPAMNGNGSAMCTSTQPKGAISLKSPRGAFTSHVALDLWIYMGTESSLDKGETVVTIGGPQGDCAVVDLADITASGFKPRCTGCNDYYWKFEVYLSAFAGYGPRSVINNANYFRGCGGNTVGELNYVEVRNYRSTAVDMCVDHIALT